VVDGRAGYTQACLAPAGLQNPIPAAWASLGTTLMIRLAGVLLAFVALHASPALAQVTLEEAQAHVRRALAEIPVGVPGYDINDRPAGWNEMILDHGQEIVEEIRLTPYGGYLIAVACDQDCRSAGVEVFDHLGQSVGGAHGSTRLGFAFNGGGLMRARIWMQNCGQPQCYLAYTITQLD
jgi:hypothetical protein